MKKAIQTSSPFANFSEQDTADKLILPYLAATHGFPKPDSLDYQAQHPLKQSRVTPDAMMVSTCQVAIPTLFLRQNGTPTI
jgi:hypothetical protein